MDDFLRTNLIDLLTFYLTAIFILNTLRRLRQYRDVVSMATSMPNRWPRVLKQIKQHWLMFLTWSVLRPAMFALTLIAAQIICSRVIWPQAQLTANDLLGEWWMVPVVGLAGGVMLAVDLYFLIRIGAIDRRETEQYLDEAEHWLTSWKAPAIRIFTFGIINPRKMVDAEVRKALEEGKGLLRRNLWWMTFQAALRILFGLSLWVAWALHPNLPGR
jgi:uncharacterized membrane protein HdeD (DUF308 family)